VNSRSAAAAPELIEQVTTALGEVVRLLNDIVNTAKIADDPHRVYSLEEVAAVTGWSLDTLREDCRQKRITFVRKGRSYGLTVKMLAAEIEKHTEGATLDARLAALVRTSGGVRPGNRYLRRAT